jgi:hypothetical protein
MVPTAVFLFERLAFHLQQHFAPFVYKYEILQFVISTIGKGSSATRESATAFGEQLMGAIGRKGVSVFTPVLIEGIENTAWKTKVFAINMISKLAARKAPSFGPFLPTIVPSLMDCVMDAKSEVASASTECLTNVVGVIKNAETRQLAPYLVSAITDPTKIETTLEELMDCTFINAIESKSLALILPICIRGLRLGRIALQLKSATVCGNICGLVGKHLMTPMR